MSASGHVVALCGGVGGAKLAFGLTRILSPDELTIVVNTGDDFEHLGLSICPDVDTVVYTLAELSDRERGWGLADETWNFMTRLGRLGGEAWFNLGDMDLAMHVERTRLVADGVTLSEATRRLSSSLGVRHVVAPMSDQRVRTVIDTADGPLPFQHYFVRDRCEPSVLGVRFEGVAEAVPSPLVSAALTRKDVRAVVICPSNPYLSVDPILSVPGIREGLAALGAPVVAISPIVGGQAIKGPASKIMLELGVVPSAAAVARHYDGLVDGLVIDVADEGDADAVRREGIQPLVAHSIMSTDDERVTLARRALEFAADLLGGAGAGR